MKRAAGAGVGGGAANILWAHDRALASDGILICGIDEVGRGPLAGNVVAACVVFDMEGDPIPGLNDSKKLTPARRESLAPIIMARARAWSIGEATPEEIDRINILQATFLAMRRALEALHCTPNLLLVDGNQKIPGTAIPQTTLVKGDGISASIAAASVLAKVHRDQQLTEAESLYPGYGFGAHKGYGTAEHTGAIARLGLTPLHRRSFCGNFIPTRE
jgi:ribonuclease HII